MQPSIIAFHGKQSIKDKYLKRVLHHYEMDEIIQGKYWENGKGCAVGCTIESSEDPHELMEKELGVPKELAYLEDVIFEELSNGKAKEFPFRFLRAIKPGSDLTKITAKMVIWQWEDEKYGLKQIPEIKEDPEVFAICEEVTNAYRKELEGKKLTQEEWEELYLKADRAWARAWAVVGAWARAWAVVGAWARAWARAGVGAGADYDERINAMADKLILLLEEAD